MLVFLNGPIFRDTFLFPEGSGFSQLHEVGILRHKQTSLVPIGSLSHYPTETKALSLCFGEDMSQKPLNKVNIYEHVGQTAQHKREELQIYSIA